MRKWIATKVARGDSKGGAWGRVEGWSDQQSRSEVDTICGYQWEIVTD